MTFTILGQDKRYFGVATCSAIPAVGMFVPFGDIRSCVLAFQAKISPPHANKILRALEFHENVKAIFQKLSEEDSYFEQRQIGIITRGGKVYAHTGKEAKKFAGHILGSNHIVLGNLLENNETLLAMQKEYLDQPSDIFLGEKILKSLLAGNKTTGDIRGRESAAILIFDRQKDSPIINLRIDCSKNPVQDLAKLFEYFMEGFFKFSDSFPDIFGNYIATDQRSDLLELMKVYSLPVEERNNFPLL